MFIKWSMRPACQSSQHMHTVMYGISVLVLFLKVEDNNATPSLIVLCGRWHVKNVYESYVIESSVHVSAVGGRSHGIFYSMYLLLCHTRTVLTRLGCMSCSGY